MSVPLFPYLPDMEATPGDYRGDRETPRSLAKILSRDFGPFDLDAAAAPHNAVCDKFYTEADDGTRQPWGPVLYQRKKEQLTRPARVFINPPYREPCPEQFSRKALEEAQNGIASSLMLIPVTKTEQDFWHRYVVGLGSKSGPGPGASAILFVVGRISFELGGVPQTQNDHASVLILWEAGFTASASRWHYKLPIVGSYHQRLGLMPGRPFPWSVRR